MNFTCLSAEIASSRGLSLIEVELVGLDIGEAINQIGIDDILDHIGKDACVKHFDIEEAE